MVLKRRVLLACKLGIMIVAQVASGQSTHEVTAKSGEVTKNNAIDNADSEKAQADSIQLIAGGRFVIVSKTYTPPAKKKFKLFAGTTTHVDILADPNNLPKTRVEDTASKIKVNGTFRQKGTSPGSFPLRAEGNIKSPRPGGGGGGPPPTPPKLHWSAMVDGMKVVLSRNNSWSADNDLPTSTPVVQQFYGQTPVIDQVNDARARGGSKAIPVELQGTIEPAASAPPLKHFGVTQVLTTKLTAKETGKPDVVQSQTVNEGAAIPIELDLNGGSNIYYVFDAPGTGRRRLEQSLRTFPTLISFTLEFTAETTPTYKGDPVGDAFTWTVSLTVKRNAAGAIVWTTP